MIMGAWGIGKKKKESGYWGLCFTAKAANSTIVFKNVGSPPQVSLDYSLDKGANWHSYTVDDTISLASIGDSVCFAASDGITQNISSGAFSYHRFVTSGNVSATGSILSLTSSNKETAIGNQLGSRCFFRLFTATQSNPNVGLTEVEVLMLGKTLPSNSNLLGYMFTYCTNLTKVTTDITTWDTSNYNNWMNYVQSVGEFHCPSALGTNETIERGISRCPENWTVVNDV